MSPRKIPSLAALAVCLCLLVSACACGRRGGRDDDESKKRGGKKGGSKKGDVKPTDHIDRVPCGHWHAGLSIDQSGRKSEPELTVVPLMHCKSADAYRAECANLCHLANDQKAGPCAAVQFHMHGDLGVCTQIHALEPDHDKLHIDGDGGGEMHLYRACSDADGVCANAVMSPLQDDQDGICFNVFDDAVSNFLVDYDPHTVDWRSYFMTVQQLAKQEPRFCNFVVRANFHDSGAIEVTDVGTFGADGSLLIDFYEFLQPENAYDAFAAFVARVLRKLAQYFGITLADALAVAHVACVEELGGTVDILSQCVGNGTPLYLGKLEALYPFDQNSAAERVSFLPGNAAPADEWINFWLDTLNGVFDPADKPHFDFNIQEALALMGSHTLIDNQACTTVPKSNGKCRAGSKSQHRRMFIWNNDYFKDTLSGEVIVKEEPFGRAPTEEEAEELEACTFTTADGLAIKQNLECKLATAAEALGIPMVPEDNDFRFVTWLPDDTRAPCCGEDCEVCSADDVAEDEDDSDKRWCPNNEVGAALWFYTINDGNLVNAAKNPGALCDTVDCSNSPVNLEQEAANMYQGYLQFRKSQTTFDEYYATALCKLNHVGAMYSAPSLAAGKQGKPVAFTKELLTRCLGKSTSGGGCDTDPAWKGSKLMVRKPDVCCGGGDGGDGTCGERRFDYLLKFTEDCKCDEEHGADESAEDDGDVSVAMAHEVLSAFPPSVTKHSAATASIQLS